VCEFIFANKTWYVAHVLGVNYQVCVSDNICVCVYIYIYIYIYMYIYGV